eukprot:TRINITY_DN5274_c0_g1_i1.p1 TRINITY_DN5274_c0_g1~~TRINITY_DN5274_c0_g1_i1.p1  ORF type:complete len:459 (+),score=21.84 TRINITY_DN5274_c0_g1_i1:110-1486(+)
MSMSPRSKLSRVTAAELASEVDLTFKSNGKFHKSSASFASNTTRFKVKQVHSPGPSTYNPKVGGHGRGLILNTHSSRDNSKRTATDSMYNIEQKWGGRTSSTAGSAGFASQVPRNASRHADTPAPNRYQPDQTISNVAEHRSATASFRSRSPRMKVQKSHTPSPTTYSATAPETEAYGHTAVFSSTQPRLSTRDSMTPAPGAHEISGSFTKAAVKRQVGTPSFKSKCDRMSVRGNDVPAPGAYEAPSSLSRRGCTMPRSPRSKVRQTHSPGPTAYSVSGCHTTTTPATSAFRSSSARFRDDPTSANTSYYTESSFGGKSKGGAFVTTSPRLVSRHGDTPGPGSYAAQPVQATVKGASLGTSSRPGPRRSYTPGPGTYSVPGIGDRESKAITSCFGSRSGRGLVTSSTPGPGAHFSDRSVSSLSGRGGMMTSKAERFPSRPNDTPAPGHSIVAYSSFLE